MASLLVLLFPHWCMMPSHRVFSCCLVLHVYIAHLVCSYILHSCFPTLLLPLGPLCSFINPGFCNDSGYFSDFPNLREEGKSSLHQGEQIWLLTSTITGQEPIFYQPWSLWGFSRIFLLFLHIFPDYFETLKKRGIISQSRILYHFPDYPHIFTT